MIVLIANGQEFDHWEEVDINQRLNTVGSTFRLKGLMDERSVEIFKPFTYVKCEIWIKDQEKGINEVLLTGRCMNPGLQIQKVPSLTEIVGFSLPGILEQINYPPEMYPLQWSNVSLKTLAQRVCDKFDLKLKVHEGAIDACNELYESVECAPAESIKAFLSRIGEKKGVTVAHDNLGNLFLYRILNVIEASSSISEDDYHLSMTLAPNGQQMHSHVTAIQENDLLDEEEGDGFKKQVGKHTSVSPFIKGIYLPKTVYVRESKKAKEKNKIYTLQETADREIAQEARNFPVSVNKLGWDFNGRIVRAGFYLDLEAPSLFIEKTKFLVEEMNFVKRAQGQEELNFTCVLPCVYTGVLPKKSPFIL